ncbi:MAG: TonB family protein [Myxococcales bacterium]|nr:TonB family protein [Myxococcales bacterium]
MLLPSTPELISRTTDPEMAVGATSSESPILEGVFRTGLLERELGRSLAASVVFHGVLLAFVMAAAAWWIQPEPRQLSERMLQQLRASQARIVLVEQAVEPEPPPVVIQLPPEPAPAPPPVREPSLAAAEQPEVAEELPPEVLPEVDEPAAAATLDAQPEEGSAAPLAAEDSAPVEIAGPTAMDATAPAEPVAAADPGLMPGTGGRTDGDVDGQPGATAASVQQPSAGAADSEGADLGRLAARHRENMNRCFERVARYPSSLRRDRLEGDVGLAIRLDERGSIVEVRVARSSGHEALDQWAVEQAEAVGRCSAPPAELGENGLRVLLPVRYRVN